MTVLVPHNLIVDFTYEGELVPLDSARIEDLFTNGEANIYGVSKDGSTLFCLSELLIDFDLAILRSLRCGSPRIGFMDLTLSGKRVAYEIDLSGCTLSGLFDTSINRQIDIQLSFACIEAFSFAVYNSVAASVMRAGLDRPMPYLRAALDLIYVPRGGSRS